MTNKFRNKYRIESNRMPKWNYSKQGSYFITVVTQNRECNLGSIIRIRDKALVKLSAYGSITKNEWLKSFEIRQELFLDEYIIMPNHLHAIIALNPNESLHKNNDLEIKNNPLIRLPKSISSFIAGFKSSVNTEIDNYIDQNQLNIPKYNRNNHFFQPNYHDHIIRNEKKYYRIKNYIINNPKNWEEDSLLKGT
jgi:putative transposase